MFQVIRTAVNFDDYNFRTETTEYQFFGRTYWTTTKIIQQNLKLAQMQEDLRKGISDSMKLALGNVARPLRIITDQGEMMTVLRPARYNVTKEDTQP